MLMAPSRKIWPAVVLRRAMRRWRLPDWCLLGESPSHEVKCLALARAAQVAAQFAHELHPAQRADAGEQAGVAPPAQGQELAVQVFDRRGVVPHQLDLLAGLGR